MLDVNKFKNLNTESKNNNEMCQVIRSHAVESLNNLMLTINVFLASGNLSTENYNRVNNLNKILN